MKLSKSQKNILSVAISETIVTKGKNMGKLKSVLPDECYDGRTTLSLLRKGLLKFHIKTIYGSGWAATETALHLHRTKSL